MSIDEQISILTEDQLDDAVTLVVEELERYDMITRYDIKCACMDVGVKATAQVIEAVRARLEAEDADLRHGA